MTDDTLRAALDELAPLSAAATPGPWIRRWASLDVHHMTGDDALQAQADIDFAVAATAYVRAALAVSAPDEGPTFWNQAEQRIEHARPAAPAALDVDALPEATYQETAYGSTVSRDAIRAALAASATDEGPNPCIVCGFPASAVVTVCAHHREGLEHPDRVTASKCARCGRTRALAPDGTCWECAVEYRDEILDGQRARPAAPALDDIPQLHLSGAQIAQAAESDVIPAGFDADTFAVDYDEYEVFVRLSDVVRPAVPAALDVERLAKAEHASYPRDPDVKRIEWADLSDAEKAMWRVHARRHAAEYAALQEQTDDR